MSGGVDSSVAAYLLIEQGYQVEGLFMKNWDEDDGTDYCTAKDDLADAQSVCDSLGIIPLHSSANFAAEYWDNVFEHFLKEYSAGRTPNPDVLCNQGDQIQGISSSMPANLALTLSRPGTTSESIRCRCSQTQFLLKGLDNNKDQSYFLCEVDESCLEQESLSCRRAG